MNALLAGAIALSALGLAANNAHASDEKEKCYGVAKKGANDCSSSDGAHNCGAQAASDSLGTEWVFVPKGLCAKLAGGSLEPIAAATETPAPEAPAQ